MKNSSKRSLILIETSILLIFFVFALAVCTNMFAAAKKRSAAAADLNNAVIICETAAECFKAADGDMEATARLLGAESLPNDMKFYYDSRGNICEQGAAVYTLELVAGGNTAASTLSAEIILKKDSAKIYKITAVTLSNGK